MSGPAEPPPRTGTRRLLAEHGIRPDTDLGQHFLLDENLADLAVRRGRVGADDVVLEVGPGVGTLTAALARAAACVHAIEIDERLRPALTSVLAGHANVRLRFADAMRVDLGALEPAPTRVVANLPYSIATPLVLETLWDLPDVGAWCVMVQREVADRWLADHGSRLYGAPSVLLQLAAGQTFIRPVGPQAFVPRPRVESALVAFDRVAPGPSPAVRSLVQAAFATRRKTLVNALSAAGRDRAEIASAIAALGLPPAVRAEALPPAAFPELARELAWTA